MSCDGGELICADCGYSWFYLHIVPSRKYKDFETVVGAPEGHLWLKFGNEGHPKFVCANCMEPYLAMEKERDGDE